MCFSTGALGWEPSNCCPQLQLLPAMCSNSSLLSSRGALQQWLSAAVGLWNTAFLSGVNEGESPCCTCVSSWNHHPRSDWHLRAHGACSSVLDWHPLWGWDIHSFAADASIFRYESDHRAYTKREGWQDQLVPARKPSDVSVQKCNQKSSCELLKMAFLHKLLVNTLKYPIYFVSSFPLCDGLKLLLFTWITRQS